MSSRFCLPVLVALTCHGLSVFHSAQGGGFGTAVSHADVNGDGFSDVVIGEPGYDGAFVDEGRVLVYHGSATGPAVKPSWQRSGGQAYAHAGAAVAGVGDLNDDGYDDVVIGSPDFSATWSHWSGGLRSATPLRRLRAAGAIAVFLGSANGLGATPNAVRLGAEMDEHLGLAISRAGDVNDDGYDDFIVGALGTGAELGSALVFHGSPSGTGRFPSWVAVGSEPGARFGFSVGGGGDINGDGFDDVLVGAPDSGPDDLGSAWAYFGSATGLSATPSWTLPWHSGNFDGSINYTSEWGYSVAVVGDMNGNGYDDIVIGNPYYHGSPIFGVPRWEAGAVWLFGGSPSGPVNVGLSSGNSLHRGAACASAGDVNGDGRADVVFSEGGQGIARLALGQNDYWGSLSLLVAETNRFGRGLSSAGDVDGDGSDEILVGEPGSPGGTAYILAGSGPGFWALPAP